MNPAIIYTRVSTQDQAAHGISLDAQLDSLRRWCHSQGYDVAAEYCDAGISGGSLEQRLQAQEAIADACKRRCPLVITKIDRLGRSLADLISIAAHLHKAGAMLVSLKEQFDMTTPIGRVTFNILASFSQFERELATERTKDALAHKRANGESVTPVPYGYDAEEYWVETEGRLKRKLGKLTPNAAEQAIIAEMRDLRPLSYQKIADHLNCKGIRTKHGREWTRATVFKILKRSTLPSNERQGCDR